MLELSKRITGEEELMNLGIKVLGLPDFLIKTALYNKKEIQFATYDVLSNWLQQQNNRREAFIKIHAGLIRAEMNQLATELKQWVEGTEAEIARTAEEGRKKFISISAVIVKLVTQHKHL